MSYNEDDLFGAQEAANLAPLVQALYAANETGTLKLVTTAIATLLEPLQPAKAEANSAKLSKEREAIRWAEGLINQLPANHDGRNSWLLNFGTEIEDTAAQAPRQAAEAPADERCPDCGEVHPPVPPALRGLLEALGVQVVEVKRGKLH